MTRPICTHPGCEGWQIKVGSNGDVAWYANCPGCYGLTVETIERRQPSMSSTRDAIDAIEACHRSVIIDLLRDAERLDASRLATINAQHDQITRLVFEVRALTKTVAEQGRRLDRYESKAASRCEEIARTA